MPETEGVSRDELVECRLLKWNMNKSVAKKPLSGNILRRFGHLWLAVDCVEELGFVNHASLTFRIGLSQGVFTGRHCGLHKFEPAAAKKGTGMRVLLIEDDSATAQSIELMLKSESFNVYTTDLGEEGVDLGKLYDYDIILLDLNLPDMSGFEVLRSLRVSKVKTPILILSGLAGIEDKVKGLGFGADDYMTKPFHKDELIARIHAIVRRSKGHAAVGHQHRRPHRQPRPEDRRGGRRPRAPDRQGISDAGAALAPQGHHAHQGDVPQSSLRRHGRARAQDHRRVHLQAPQEACERVQRQELHRDGVGPRLRAARADRGRVTEFRRKPDGTRRSEENPAARRGFCLSVSTSA